MTATHRPTEGGWGDHHRGVRLTQPIGGGGGDRPQTGPDPSHWGERGGGRPLCIYTSRVSRRLCHEELRPELRGLSTWTPKDHALAEKARELLDRHVFGSEDLDERHLHDDFLQVDVLRRRGAEGFVREMKEKAERVLAEPVALATLCAAAAHGAEPYRTEADVKGAVHQLELAVFLGQPVKDRRAVLLCGPTRTHKSHVGHQLFKLQRKQGGLPEGSVVLVADAPRLDLHVVL